MGTQSTTIRQCFACVKTLRTSVLRPDRDQPGAPHVFQPPGQRAMLSLYAHDNRGVPRSHQREYLESKRT